MFSLNRIRMNSKKMRKKIGFIKVIQLWGIVFLTALASVIVGIDLVTTYYYSNIHMDTLRTDHVEQQKQMSKREVERVVGMMNYDRTQNDALKGTKSYVNVEKLQAEWMERINNIRFGKNLVGYLFANDWKGKSLAHGAQPNLINKELWEYEDSRGNKTTQLLIAESKKKDGGFSNFWWRKPDTGKESPKIVYSKGIPEWELFVGSGVYVDDIEQNIAILQEVLDKQTKTKIFISLIIVVIAFALFLIVFKLLSNRLRKDLNLFISFFDQAAFSDKKIDRETVQFVEFDQMAEYANKMLQDKVKVEEKIRTLSSVVEQSTEGMAITEFDGKIIYVNKAWCKMHGYKGPKELLGKSLALFHNKEQLKNDVEPFNDKVKKHGTYSGEVGHITKEGKAFPTLMTTTLLKDDQGNPVSLSGIAKDITEHKRSETAIRISEEKYHSLVENIPDVLWTTDQYGNTTYISPAVKKIYGYSPEEIYRGGDHLWFDRIHPNDTEKVMQAYQELFNKNKRYIIEYRIKRKDGKWVWLYDKSTGIREKDGKTYADGIFTDITELRRAEESLKEYSERLEQMVEERTKELKDAQEQLVRREKLAILGQLAGGVGHELRNPLGVISNAVYYLKMVMPDAEETIKEYLETISEEVNRSTKIISDLLDFSRIKSVDREETAVSDLVAQVLEKQPTPENIKLATTIPSDFPPVFVDNRQISQVLVNLVTNACQAMPEGGKLSISAQAKKDKVQVSFTDTGSGISKENMKNLFEPLFTTKARGIGLGLAVSKNLVEANGGSIEVESEEGKGSIFSVILPIKEVA